MISWQTRLRKGLGILRHASYRRALLRAGVAAGVEHEQVLRWIQPATVVDIGANRGQFALVVRRLFPEARILAFEPLAEPAERFQRIFDGDPRVRLHRVAVGPRAMRHEMHVSAADDSSSLLPIGERQVELFPETVEKEIQEVEVVPLHTRVRPEDLQAPALLKIDVQGYEAEVLKGCEPLLSCFDFVYVECSFEELYVGQALADAVVLYLRERGFQWRGIYHPMYDPEGRCLQGDFLFERGDQGKRRLRTST